MSFFAIYELYDYINDLSEYNYKLRIENEELKKELREKINNLTYNNLYIKKLTREKHESKIKKNNNVDELCSSECCWCVHNV